MDDEDEWPGNMEVLRRLHHVTDRARGTVGGLTSSTTVKQVVEERDLLKEVVDATHKVLVAVTAPKPHPEWGDDGHRYAVRGWALEALAEIEEKVEVRRRRD